MKAIIPAAGRGTRFLPITKVIPKEMLPIGAKPAIQVIAEEARDAGVDEVIIVTSPHKPLIREYFAGEDIGVKVTFCDQLEQKGLGHAVLQAAPLLAQAHENVLILLGDALVAGEMPARKMVEISKAADGASVIGVECVPREKVSRYGIVKPMGGMETVLLGAPGGRPLPANGIGRARSPSAPNWSMGFPIVDLVEKPTVEEAPSNLAIAGRYLLDPAIFDLLATQVPGRGGEIQLTDAIRRLLALKRVYGYCYPGKRQDIGNPDGYYAALTAFR